MIDKSGEQEWLPYFINSNLSKNSGNIFELATEFNGISHLYVYNSYRKSNLLCDNIKVKTTYDDTNEYCLLSGSCINSPLYQSEVRKHLSYQAGTRIIELGNRKNHGLKIVKTFVSVTWKHRSWSSILTVKSLLFCSLYGDKHLWT